MDCFAGTRLGCAGLCSRVGLYEKQKTRGCWGVARRRSERDPDPRDVTRATATCSEEVGLDDGSSGWLTALRKRWSNQTLRSWAGWLWLGVPQQSKHALLLLGSDEPARSEMCRFAFPCRDITTDILIDDRYRYTQSLRLSCRIDRESIPCYVCELFMFPQTGEASPWFHGREHEKGRPKKSPQLGYRTFNPMRLVDRWVALAVSILPACTCSDGTASRRINHIYSMYCPPLLLVHGHST